MIKVAMRSRVGRESERAVLQHQEPAHGEGTALLCALLSPGLPKTRWPHHLHGGQGRGILGFRWGSRWCCRGSCVGRRRSESGGFSCRWRRLGSLDPSPHSALSHSPQPHTDFSGATKCCLKCVLSLIQMKALVHSHGPASTAKPGSAELPWMLMAVLVLIHPRKKMRVLRHTFFTYDNTLNVHLVVVNV